MDNKAQADKEKDLGNQALSAGNTEQAISHYTKAIELDPNNHILYSNRSAAYAKLKKYDQAVTDGDKAITIAPGWSKGYSRKGTALCFKGEYEDARATFMQGLEKCPNDPTLRDGLRDVNNAEQESQSSDMSSQAEMFGNVFGKAFQGDIWGKLRANAKTRAYCDDPAFVALFSAIAKQPAAVINYLKDQRVSTALTVLMGVDVPADDESPSSSSSTPTPTPSSSSSSTSTPAASAPKKEEPKKEPEPQPAANSDLPENKRLALAEKEAGNKLYKEKKFDEAMKHYERAAEHDKEDMTYLNNIAAIHFEQNNSELCIQTCQKAIDVGRYNFNDFKLISRAYHRMGNAYSKLEKYEEAVKAYESALTEYRNPESLNALRKVEKLRDKKKEQEYLDPAKAEEAKEKGNEAFKNGQNVEAIGFYTEAIKRDPSKQVYYSNRAAAYTRVGEYKMAENDCDKCLELDPNFVKAYSRKGTVQFLMKQYHKALETYDKGLKLDAENAELTEGVNRTLEAIDRQQNGEVDEEAVKNAVNNDQELQEILADPVMRQILSNMQSDPKSAQHYLKDPVVSAKIQKLISAGVLKVK
eukprot:TRINITY_DN635_c0_g1_i1.p1 TRINITY_DN635_c0_g1~~TRINITY_DN635_c0_g1_i1.p1  ORF type:complete len:584 (+),score=193.96 TRINITY_DN635_c0_g1_i1:81-1832(+)